MIIVPLFSHALPFSGFGNVFAGQLVTLPFGTPLCCPTNRYQRLSGYLMTFGWYDGRPCRSVWPSRFMLTFSWLWQCGLCAPAGVLQALPCAWALAAPSASTIAADSVPRPALPFT